MSTRTYVVLEISKAAHAEIKAKLLAAGYDHAIRGSTIDMHGIAVEPEAEPKVQRYHECHFDSLRIQNDDGRIFSVCLQCGARKYEGPAYSTMVICK